MLLEDSNSRSVNLKLIQYIIEYMDAEERTAQRIKSLLITAAGKDFVDKPNTLFLEESSALGGTNALGPPGYATHHPPSQLNHSHTSGLFNAEMQLQNLQDPNTTPSGLTGQVKSLPMNNLRLPDDETYNFRFHDRDDGTENYTTRVGNTKYPENSQRPRGGVNLLLDGNNNDAGLLLEEPKAPDLFDAQGNPRKRSPAAFPFPVRPLTYGVDGNGPPG